MRHMIRTMPDREELHKTYGGLIYPTDFCTYGVGNRNMASRAAADLRFDGRCRKNLECTKRTKRENKEYERSNEC